MDAGSPTQSRERQIAELAQRQHGVVARRQLVALGMSRTEIANRLGRSALHQLHVGVYALGVDLPSPNRARMAAVLACGPEAVLSHRSAARLWSIAPGPEAEPEVTTPPRSRVRRPGIVCRRAFVAVDERVELRGIAVTSISRTVFDLAGVVSMRELERAFHEAEAKRLSDTLSLPQLLARYPHRPGNVNVRRLLAAREPSGTTESELEERFLDFLDRRGIPRPLLNATLPLRGRLIRPDCMWRERRVVVELDGRAAHGTDLAFERDRRRDRELAAVGWRYMRVTWRSLHREPDAIAADLRELLKG